MSEYEKGFKDGYLQSWRDHDEWSPPEEIVQAHWEEYLRAHKKPYN